MKNKYLALTVAILLAAFTFGCSKSGWNTAAAMVGDGERSQAQTSESTGDSAKAPLSLDGDGVSSSASGSVLYVTINGITEQYSLVGMVDASGRYSIMFGLYDNKGYLTHSLALMVPGNMQVGEQYRYDGTDLKSKKCMLLYSDVNAGKDYSALNAESMKESAEYGFDSVDTRAGNQFVIAIDEVSADGMLVSGRYMAKFVGSNGNASDQQSVTIEESLFVLDLTQAS